MHHPLLKTIGLATGLMMLVIGTFAAAAQAAPRPDGSDFSCRASALRVVAGTTIEPVVANAPDSPCAPASDSIVNTTTAGPVTVDVALAATDQKPANLASAPAAEGDNATAGSSVSNPVIALPGLAISASVLTATAAYTCTNGQPVPSGSTVVTNLTVNGTTIPVLGGPQTVPLGPLGNLFLNQTVQEPNRITTRALNLDTPVVDIVIAEAIADIKGNPCAKSTQCSDAIDNDGDGFIDPTDPGCLSGPGGAFNPADDLELDTECSDAVDNDGDGKIDPTDPGCLSGPGGTYDPTDDSERDTECSDGRDNDGDGKIDFPADKGCTSRDDNSERTPAGTSKLGSDPSGIARLGLRGPCVKNSFEARVTGRSISRVVFFLDGRRVRSVSEAPFATRIAPTKPGRHQVRAQVTFLPDSRTKARTLQFAFERCAPKVRFTG